MFFLGSDDREYSKELKYDHRATLIDLRMNQGPKLGYLGLI